MIFSLHNDSLLLRNASELLRIEPWGAGLRVRATPAAAMPSDPGALLEPPPPATGPVEALLFPPPPEPQRGEAEFDAARVRNGAIEAVVSTGGRIRFVDTATGRDLLEERTRDGTPPRKTLTRVPARSFRAHATGGWSAVQRFEAGPEEKLYGMGQYPQPNLDLKGCELELVQRNGQTTVPFVVSSRGYGFLWNNPAQGSVVFGRNGTTWRADSTGRIDYWVCAGAAPAAILSAYADVTGHPPAMPEWALGFWQSKCRYRTQDELLGVARRYQALGIPLSAIVCDYFHWFYEGDFDFDRTFWPDPPAMVAELRAMGVEPVVSVWPTIDPRSRNAEALRERGFLARAIRGPDLGLGCDFNRTQFLDVTNPDARAFAWAKIRETYRAYGFRSFWLDLAEPEIAADPDNLRYAAGPATAVGNRYPLDYERMFYENLRAEGETQIASLSRSAWAGSQRYGALLWSGDIPSTFWSLRNQLSVGLSAGMAGIPWWNADIGGFFDAVAHDPAFHELLARWFAFAVFTPVMRLHGSRDPQEPGPGSVGGGTCGSGAPNEVWSYGPELQEIMVAHIRLRERLRPYLRRLFAEAERTLAPLMRPMFWHAPDDPSCRDADDQYFFGPDLVVAPIFEAGARSRSVRLPAGSVWIDARTGARHEGGTTLLADAPLSSIPVFVREGAAVYDEAFAR